MGTWGSFENRRGGDHLVNQPLNEVVAYGTLSSTHLKRMSVQVIGERAAAAIPPLPHGHAGGPHCALEDISIRNRLAKN